MGTRRKKILSLILSQENIREDDINTENRGSTSNNKEVKNDELDNEDFSSDDSVTDTNYMPYSTEEDNTSASSASNVDEDCASNLDEESSVDDNDDDHLETSNSGIILTNDNDWHAIQDQDSSNPLLLCPEMPTYNFDTSDIKSPLNAYQLFITDELLDIIVKETNRYAKQSLQNLWINTDRNEIKRFFSILLVMGLNQLPAVNGYWSKDPIYRNDFIANAMIRDRFLLLLRNLHFCNNEDQNIDKSNRLYKIENFLNLLNSNYRTVLTPGRILVIDESMVPFRGRLLFRQYIPNKSHKYGIKLYKLCTVDGYTNNVIICTGKNEKINGQSHSESIVHELLKSINEKEGRYLYADNFYSSLPLASALHEKKIVYCGTLQSNRKGIPKDFSKKMRKGEVYGKQNGCLKIVKWVDKRSVLMLTTDPDHNIHLISTGKKTRSGEDILKPKAVIDYNKAKKGVDQMSSYHSVLRRGLKWYRKLMFELLMGTSVVNAWIIFNKISATKLSITEFRKTLATELVIPPPAATDNTAPKRKAHTFVKPTGPGRKKRKMCQGCYKELRLTLSSHEANNKVTKVTSYCNDCTGKPGLCLSCFNKLHKI